MKARTRTTWRLARLNGRLGNEIHGKRLKRDEKRAYRGGAPRLGIWFITPYIGKNHRQGPRKFGRKRAPLILLAPNTPKQRPAERPATRPSWAIMAGKPRKGMGYSGSPSDWESL